MYICQICLDLTDVIGFFSSLSWTYSAQPSSEAKVESMMERVGQNRSIYYHLNDIKVFAKKHRRNQGIPCLGRAHYEKCRKALSTW